MDTQYRIDMSILNECYGSLLTAHQSEMMRLYYDLDVSLGEIAEQYSVSRQAVRDAIMRGEKALQDYESKLHLVERMTALAEGLGELADMTSDSRVRDKIGHLISMVEGDCWAHLAD